MLDYSRYASLLSRYVEHFGREAIYCGVFDDLQENPQAFINDLLVWFGLDTMVFDELELAARLPASRARSLPIARLAKHAANLARQRNATSLIGRVKRSAVVQKILYAPLDVDEPRRSEGAAQWVRERLAPEITQLEDMFGVDLRRRWNWAV